MKNTYLAELWRLLQPSQDLTILCHLILVILLFSGIGASLEGENGTPKRRVNFYDPSGICDIGILGKPPVLGISAGQIYEEVWGEDGENCGTAVASVIGQIRRKLTPDMPKAGYIRTVLGSGYKFEVPQGMAE